jgi:hypothetical protein
MKFGHMKFKDFLCESFVPRYTEFGSDLNNKKWLNLDKDFKVTFFKSLSETFVVIFRKNHIGFGVTYTTKDPDLSDIKTFSDVENKFSFKPRAVGSASRIFNQVIYVICDYIEKEHPEEIYFNGSNIELNKLYSHLVMDKSFLKVLLNLKYEYVGKGTVVDQNTEVFKFKRIEENK